MQTWVYCSDLLQSTVGHIIMYMNVLFLSAAEVGTSCSSFLIISNKPCLQMPCLFSKKKKEKNLGWNMLDKV